MTEIDPAEREAARIRHDERARAHAAGLPRTAQPNPRYGQPASPPEPGAVRRLATSRWLCPVCGDGQFESIGPHGSVRCANGHWYLTGAGEGRGNG